MPEQKSPGRLVRFGYRLYGGPRRSQLVSLHLFVVGLVLVMAGLVVEHHPVGKRIHFWVSLPVVIWSVLCLASMFAYERWGRRQPDVCLTELRTITPTSLYEPDDPGWLIVDCGAHGEIGRVTEGPDEGDLVEDLWFAHREQIRKYPRPNHPAKQA